MASLPSGGLSVKEAAAGLDVYRAACVPLVARTPTPSPRRSPLLSLQACAGSSSSTRVAAPLLLSQPPSRSAFDWADESDSPERPYADSTDLVKFCGWIAPCAFPEHENLDTGATLEAPEGSPAQVLADATSHGMLPSDPDPNETAHFDDNDVQIPLDEAGELSSVGSIGHSAGKCQPCLFWFQLTCGKGVRCTYCHLQHPGLKKKRIRMSKKVRLELQAMRDSEPGVPGSAGVAESYGKWAARQERPIFGSCPVAP